MRSQNGAQAVLEVSVDSMAILEEGDYTAVVAVRDRSVPAGVVSELEVVFRVTVFRRPTCSSSRPTRSPCVHRDRAAATAAWWRAPPHCRG